MLLHCNKLTADASAQHSNRDLAKHQVEVRNFILWLSSRFCKWVWGVHPYKVSPGSSDRDTLSGQSPNLECNCNLWCSALEHDAGTRTSYHAATPPWSPSQPQTAANSPDRGPCVTGQAMHGSMLGSLHMTQQQAGSAAHMASQLQLTASQLAAPPDPAAQNPLACRQLMLQVSLSCMVAVIPVLFCCNSAISCCCSNMLAIAVLC